MLIADSLPALVKMVFTQASRFILLAILTFVSPQAIDPNSVDIGTRSTFSHLDLLLIQLQRQC